MLGTHVSMCVKRYSHVNILWSTFATPKLKFCQHFHYKLQTLLHILMHWKIYGVPPRNILEASLVSKYPFGFAWLVLVINPYVVKVSNSSLFYTV